MSSYDQTVWGAVTQILQTIKDVPCARVTQENRLSFKDSQEASDMPAVFWAVDIQDASEETWATDTISYRYPISIYYVRPSNVSSAESLAGTTVESAIESRLAAVRDAFVYYTGTAFQLAGTNPARSIGHTQAANDIFLGLENGYLSGSLDVSLLVGEYA